MDRQPTPATGPSPVAEAADLDRVIRGRAWVIGDSVDTNQLAGDGTPGGCLRGVRPEFAAQVRPGDILVAGRNFGCGSHRQGAVEALKSCGIAAVLAESVARIHLRNSIAIALPTFGMPGIVRWVADGAQLEIDYRIGQVRNLATGAQLRLPKWPRGVERIYAAGGLLPLLAERLTAEGFVPPPTA